MPSVEKSEDRCMSHLGLVVIQHPRAHCDGRADKEDSDDGKQEVEKPEHAAASAERETTT